MYFNEILLFLYLKEGDFCLGNFAPSQSWKIWDLENIFTVRYEDGEGVKEQDEQFALHVNNL